MKKTTLAGVLILGLAAAAVLFFFDPSQMSFYPGCPFHRLTGLDCPGCGSTRAMHALLHGRLAVALHFNAMLILSLPLFAWLGLRAIWSGIKGRPPVAFQPFWVWLYLAAWVAFGILRNLPFQPFTSFAA
jgi:hypothetical protein